MKKRASRSRAPRPGDAFGLRLWGWFNGDETCDVIERDDGYVDASPHPGVYFAAYRRWHPLDRKAMKLVRGRVLDIGCGAGRHSLYLQGRGFRVTGIDVSPLAVRTCRGRGLRDARVCPIEKIGPGLGRFDTIIMMGNNFGLFGSLAKGRRILRRILRITSPRARIVAQAMDPYGTKNPVHLAYHALNRRRGRLSGQLRLRVRYKNVAGPWFDYLFVSRKELREMLKGTGWRLARTVEPRGAAYIALIEKEQP